MKAVKAWLEKNGIVVDKVCTEKPPAVCYIDDRAICFDGHPENLLNQIIWFKPWWENTPMDVKLAEPETGLYPKYCVVNNATGSVVEDCFVLGPKKDRAARLALLYYSDLVKTENPQLASELKSWIMGIETEGSK